ncbi:MAG: hypothetical protein CL927_04220 [Deltaproteobacteria bacterium]|nr:hypothetical protein [Deltaproteobacteria bacterium]HCH66586.1 hypothetical protein [Deltaproteobacteria bacterium]
MLSPAFLLLVLGSAMAGRREHMPPPEAPVVQEDRVEITVDARNQWTVVPAGMEGLVLLGTDNRGASWTLVRYDTGFRQQWVSTWDAPSRRVRLVDHALSDGVLTLLLHQPKRAAFTLVEVQLHDGSVQEHSLTAPSRLRSTWSVDVVGDDRYVLSAVRRPTARRLAERELLHVDATGRVAVVPIDDHLAARSVEVLRITTDEQADAMDLSLATEKRNRRSVHTVSVRDGMVTDRRTLPPPVDGSHNLLTAQRVRTAAADMMVGTYAAGARGTGAQGLFVSKLSDDGSEAWRRTISFTDLDRFFDYMPKRRQARVERRAQRKRERGGDLHLKYLLNLHDVVQTDSGMLVIGEAFYPEYETRQRVVTYVENGVTRTRIEYYTVFVGYRYTHALVVALDEHGETLWDASFEIGNILSYAIRDRVQVDVDGDRITMVYAYGGRVFSKVATPEGILDEKTALATEAVGGGRVRRTWATHTEHWYDQHFLIWSYDKVVGGQGGRRKVFSFSTVSQRDPAGETPDSTKH